MTHFLPSISQKFIRHYSIQKLEHCRVKAPVHANFETPESVPGDKISGSGVIIITEKIFGPISISIENSRCSLDMKNCEKRATFIIREVCKRMLEENAIYTNVFKSIQPPLKCPVEPGSYTIKPTEINLGILALIPIDDQIYLTHITVSSAVNATKSRQIIWCFTVETKIVKIRIKT